jgi:hypothetical protein
MKQMHHQDQFDYAESSYECYSSSTASMSSNLIKYVACSTDDILDLIPHFTEIKPYDFRNYYSFSNDFSPKKLDQYSSDESIYSRPNEFEFQKCSTPRSSIRLRPSTKRTKRTTTAKHNNTAKLDKLIKFVYDNFIEESKNDESRQLDESFSTPISPLVSPSLSSVSSLSSVEMSGALERSKEVQETANKLQQIRAHLNENDERIK